MTAVADLQSDVVALRGFLDHAIELLQRTDDTADDVAELVLGVDHWDGGLDEYQTRLFTYRRVSTEELIEAEIATNWGHMREVCIRTEDHIQTFQWGDWRDMPPTITGLGWQTFADTMRINIRIAHVIYTQHPHELGKGW